MKTALPRIAALKISWGDAYTPKKDSTIFIIENFLVWLGYKSHGRWGDDTLKSSEFALPAAVSKIHCAVQSMSLDFSCLYS